MAVDTFNRANESPVASPWVKGTGSAGGGGQDVNLTSNALHPEVNSGGRVYYYSGSCATADQYSQMKLVTQLTVDQVWGPAVRCMSSGTLDCYTYSQYASVPAMVKLVAGSYTSIENVGWVKGAVGDTVKITVDGSTLRGYLNGVEQDASPATDTTYSAAGQGAGFYIYDGGGELDDFQGGDYTVPSQTLGEDDFNRLNESPFPMTTPWAKANGSGSSPVELIGGDISAPSDGHRVFYQAGAAVTADQFAQVTIVTVPGTGDEWAPAVRINDADGYPNCYVPWGKWLLASSLTILNASWPAVVAGDVLKVTIEGSTLRGFINGSEVTGSPVTDTSLTTTGDGVGFQLYSGGGVLDDWRGGDGDGVVETGDDTPITVPTARRLGT